MKKRLKMKRYEDGGDVDDDVEPEVIRRSSASGVRVNYEDKAEAKPKRKAASDDDSYDRKEMSRPASASRKEAKEDTSAVTGRMLAKRDTRSAEEKAAENKYIRENITTPLVTSVGAGRVAKGAMEVGRAAEKMRKLGQAARTEREAGKMSPAAEARAGRIRERSEMERMREGKSFGDRDMGYKRGGSVGSASRRADGIAMRGKTKGRLI